MFVLCHLKGSVKQIWKGRMKRCPCLVRLREDRGVFLELKFISRAPMLTVYQELTLLREVSHPLGPEVL